MENQKEAAREAEDRRRRKEQCAAENSAAVGPMEERIRQLNPGAVILPVSARTGEGMDAIIRWILDCRSQILADNTF